MSCDRIYAEIVLLQRSLLGGLWSWLLPIVFAVATILVALWIPCGRWKRDKTK
jgi:hypothetical protein